MKLTKTKLRQIIQETVQESFGAPGQPDWGQEASVVQQYPGIGDEPELETTLMGDIKLLLDNWTSQEPDAVEYHKQLQSVYDKHTSGDL
jgi:hypothetical protein